MYNYGSWRDNPIKTETLTQKDANGNFNFTIPTYSSNYYDIVINYDGNNNYAASSKEGSIYIVDVDVGSITLRKSGNSLYAKFKDNNGNIISNRSFTNVIFNIILNSSQTLEIKLDSATSDANGEVHVDNITTGNGAYVVYGDVTSNTISW